MLRFLFVLSSLIGVVWAQCNGACQITSDSCPVSYVAGLCPGASNIECCQEITDSCPGACQTNSLPCAGTYKSGLCPGSSDVLCCVGVQPFADREWDCGNPDCTQVVASGSSQPNYECAEFVSRSLSTAGYLPGLGAFAAQSAYGSWSYGGKVYDLLWVSNLQGGPLGLREALIALGWVSVSASSIKDGSAVFVDGSDGPYSHVAVGVGSNLCDAHNNARYHVTCSSYYTINEVRNPPGFLNYTDLEAGPLPEHLRKDTRPWKILPSN